MLALLLAGPLVGVEFGVAAFTNPLVAGLPDGAYRTVRSGGSKLLGTVMPFWYLGTLVVLVAAALMSRDAAVIAAAAVLGLAVLLTVAVLVPINNRIAGWATDAEVSRELAGRWDRLHWLRVGLLVVMFAVLVPAVGTA